MDKGKQISTILKNILDQDKLNVYVGYKKMSYYGGYYEVNYGGLYNYNTKYPQVRYCGVYWLYDGDEVVYIGHSSNIVSRVRSHVSSGKVWDKVKIVLLDDLKIAISVERTLLLNIETKYNNPKFNRGYTARSRYRSLKSSIRMALIWYGMYSHLSKDEMLDIGPGLLDAINNIDFYRKYVGMSFKEYEENFNLKLKGLKHDLLIT